MRRNQVCVYVCLINKNIIIIITFNDFILMVICPSVESVVSMRL